MLDKEHTKEPGSLLKTLIEMEKTDTSQEDMMNCQLAGRLMESIRPCTTLPHSRAESPAGIVVFLVLSLSFTLLGYCQSTLT